MKEHLMLCPNTRLRDERLRRQWTQQTLADHLETTKLTIGRWERGISVPGPHFRLKLCTLFGRSAEELGLVDTHSLPAILPESNISEEEQMRSSPTDIPGLWTVPHRRNRYFTGRDELLNLLDQHLSGARQEETTATYRAALTQPQAMKGLGGIGKTQIAVEYAYRAREQGHYTHTLWTNATSQEALMTSFTEHADVIPEFAAKEETDQYKLVEAIKRWLEQCPERWLLIFDNADDLSLIQEYIPRQGNGSILLTTRANAVGSLAAAIDVEKMGFVEGTHLLLLRAQRFAQASDEEMNEAGNIVMALDHFPLALEQAGAYIEETGCSFGNYLLLYQTHHEALLARRGTQSTNYPDSVATTWSLSFQKVEQANPAAADLLRLCAFLAPDHIPEELLKDGAAYWTPVLQQAAADLFTFNQMLEALLAFSLIKRLTDDRLLSIHRLVQTIQMDRMEREEQCQWAERVVRATNAAFPRKPKEEVVTWPQCLRYLEQAQACATLIQYYLLLLPEGMELLDRVAIYLREHALYSIAEPLFQQAISIYEQQLGPEHLKRVNSLLNNLAHLYRLQGKYAEAESLYQRVLAIHAHQLRLEPSQVIFSLTGLAIVYSDQGRYREAEPLFQQAISIHEQQLGSEHSDVSYPLTGLATVYLEQGKYREAESFFQRALQIREQQLGSEHPDTASPLNGLAIVSAEQGRYREAESFFQRALRIREQQLGSEHPTVAFTLNNLASLSIEQGRYGEAEPLYQRVLAIHEQHLGREHPQVAYPLAGLATIYLEQEKYMEAESFFQRALRIREQQLGSEHPTVAYLLDGLATLYSKQKRYVEAELLFQRVLRIREQALEPQHPDTAETLHRFAALREAQGKCQEAALLYQHALAIREYVFGTQHQKTQETRTAYTTLLQHVPGGWQGDEHDALAES